MTLAPVAWGDRPLPDPRVLVLLSLAWPGWAQRKCYPHAARTRQLYFYRPPQGRACRIPHHSGKPRRCTDPDLTSLTECPEGVELCLSEARAGMTGDDTSSSLLRVRAKVSSQSDLPTLVIVHLKPPSIEFTSFVLASRLRAS